MRPMKVFAAALATAFVAGCFTVKESVFPEVPMVAAASTNLTLTVRGFETVFVEKVPLFAYQTVYQPGYYGRHHYHPGHFETVPVVDYIDENRESLEFRDQANDRLESAGFVLKANPADYIVEVKFTGPFEVEDDSASMRALLFFGSIMTFDRGSAEWRARLKIYDNRTGRLLFTRDYTENYSVTIFSPIPLFGPCGAYRTNANHMQSWCLTALTDKVTSEAAAFLNTL